jgi:citrate lyase subunit beta/citryl-CoA lyase
MSDEPALAMRSVLFAPGDHPRRAEKAFTVGADAVILDLEDAVAPARKAGARAAVVERLRAPRAARGYVRINAVTSQYWQTDIDVTVGPWLEGIVIPKAESAEQILALDARIRAREIETGLRPGALELLPLIETALGIVNARSIAGAVGRIRRLAFGGADYTLDLDLQWSVEEHELAYARAHLTHASRAAGIEAPIDTVVTEIRDLDRLRTSARAGRRMGFQGKLCIHPDQVGPCNEIFTPSEAEVARAMAIVTAFEAAEAAGSAAIEVEGALVDYPIVAKARRVLAAAGKA